METLYETTIRPLAPLVEWWATGGVRAGERFGVASAERPDARLIWLHAASAGEVVAAGALALGLREQGWREAILLTTFTEAGAAAAARAPGDTIQQLLPYDQPRWVDRFLDSWRPDLGVLLISEVWPVLLARAERRGIPMALVSAGLSDRSLTAWAAARWLGLRPLRGLAAVQAADEDRAAALSPFLSCAVEVGGDLKGSADSPVVDAELVSRLRGMGRHVLGACTHPGEDEVVLAAAKRAGVRCVLAPRHPERGAAVAALAARRLGGPVGRRSERPPSPDDRAYVIDTFGELGSAYAAADVAFVGGSVTRRGGHSPAEGAACGCALVIGPDSRSNAATTRELLAAGGLVQTKDVEAALVSLLADPQQRAELGEAARATAAGWQQRRRDTANWLERLVPSGFAPD